METDGYRLREVGHTPPQQSHYINHRLYPRQGKRRIFARIALSQGSHPKEAEPPVTGLYLISSHRVTHHTLVGGDCNRCKAAFIYSCKLAETESNGNKKSRNSQLYASVLSRETLRKIRIAFSMEF